MSAILKTTTSAAARSTRAPRPLRLALTSRLRQVSAASLIALLAGCASPPPATPQLSDEQRLAQANVAAQPPVGSGAAADTPSLDWRAVVRDPRLRQWITLALAHNRDLRVALLNVQRAQAQLTVADASRLPTLGAGGQCRPGAQRQGRRGHHLDRRAAGHRLGA